MHHRNSAEQKTVVQCVKRAYLLLTVVESATVCCVSGCFIRTTLLQYDGANNTGYLFLQTAARVGSLVSQRMAGAVDKIKRKHLVLFVAPSYSDFAVSRKETS